MSIDMKAFNRFAKSFQPQDIIFCEYEPGDAFYLIQSGRVKITKIMGDIEKTIDILQPNEFFGEMALLEGAPRSATAIAVEEVVVLEFNRQNFEILMMGNPQMAMKLLKLFAKRIYDQKRRFMILTLDDDQARVADVFLMLSENSTNITPDSDERIFKTSIDDIAHWAGMTPGRAKSIMSQLASQRRIEMYQDRIVVKNINDFERFVSSKRKNERTE